MVHLVRIQGIFFLARRTDAMGDSFAAYGDEASQPGFGRRNLEIKRALVLEYVVARFVCLLLMK